MANLGDQPVLEPLSFAAVSTTKCHLSLSIKVHCLFCDVEYNLPTDFVVLNKHLEDQHQLIINCAQEIADLPKYLDHWRKRIENGLRMREICKSASVEPKDTDSKEFFHYILSDEVEEDKQLRSRLHLEKLQERLDYQQIEREDDSFSRICLFCTRHFHFNRSALFQHMSEYHHFTIGHPDNLVYTNELLAVLEEKLHSLQCLYCEKTFKDAFVLKEHMRKKRHRRLRLSNYLYRQFFIVYPEVVKMATDLQSSSDDDDDNDNGDNGSGKYSDELEEHDDHNVDDNGDVDDDTDDSSSIEQNEFSEWNDWVGKPEPEAVCLFCTFTSSDTNALLTHMKDAHRFDLTGLAVVNKLSYYQQVKLINYIRRQVHYKTCITCTEKFECLDGLQQHLDTVDHSSQLPDKSLWNQPQYFFPTFENDSLLCALVDNDEVVGDAGEEVIAEDLPDAVTGPHSGQGDMLA